MVEYIPREAAVTVCDEQCKECLRKSDFCGDTVAWNICADIKAIPAADVAPVVHGHWIPFSDGDWVECSECGKGCDVIGNDYMKAFNLFCQFYKYCPYCGSKMDGGADNG